MDKLKQTDSREYPGAAESLRIKPSEKAVREADKKINNNPRSTEIDTK